MHKNKIQRDTAEPNKNYNLCPRPPRNYTNFRHLAAQQLLVQHIFSTPAVNHIFDSNGKKQSIDKLRLGADGKIWEISLSNE